MCEYNSQLGPADESCRIIWKTVKLGTGLRTVEDFCRAFKESGMSIGKHPKRILETLMAIAVRPREIDLVKVTVADLGFKGDAYWNQILPRIKELGLELCPMEVGFQLRLQYPEQPDMEVLYILIEEIRDFSGYRSTSFELFCQGSTLSLDSSIFLQNSGFISSTFDLIFVLPREC